MSQDKKTLGARGEDIAQKYFENKGYETIARNWHAGRYGEIDLIVTSGSEVIFIEVKTRSGVDYGYPEEAVNKAKQIKWRGAAMAFTLRYPQLPINIRFDVIALILAKNGDILSLKHYEGVELTG